MEIWRLLFTFGVIFSLLGIAMMLGFKGPRLPGDIIIRKQGFTFAFPITSAIIISIILTIILNFIFEK